jgi:hypothetical protein
MRTASHRSFTECLEAFSVIADPVCDLCGLPLERSLENDTETGAIGPGPGETPVPAKAPALCIAWRADPFHFDRARSFARYEDSLVRAIVLLKFEFAYRRAVSASRSANQSASGSIKMRADLIVPVPLHKIRRRERGFNQAELLSKRRAKRLRIPHEGALAVRKRLLTSHHGGKRFVAHLPHA